MNGKNFILEFSPKGPRFYCNYNRFKEGTNGYITLIKDCSEEESIEFIGFVERTFANEKKVNTKKKLTTEFVLECLDFYNNYAKNIYKSLRDIKKELINLTQNKL